MCWVKSEAFHSCKYNYELTSYPVVQEGRVMVVTVTLRLVCSTLDEWSQVQSFLNVELLLERSIKTNNKFYKEINFFLNPLVISVTASNILKVVLNFHLIFIWFVFSR